MCLVGPIILYVDVLCHVCPDCFRVMSGMGVIYDVVM